MTVAWRDISEHIRNRRQACMMLNIHGSPDKDCLFVATQAHHGIFSRDVKFEDWLDHPLNVTPSCANCNTKRIADNDAARERFFEHQLFQYGKKLMRDWLAVAPVEITRRPEYKRFWERVN